MVSADAGSAARVMPKPAIADTPVNAPANAIARIVLFLSSMIGLLLIEWCRGDWKWINETHTKPPWLRQRLNRFAALQHYIFVMQHRLLIRFMTPIACRPAPARLSSVVCRCPSVAAVRDHENSHVHPLKPSRIDRLAQ